VAPFCNLKDPSGENGSASKACAWLARERGSGAARGWGEGEKELRATDRTGHMRVGGGRLLWGRWKSRTGSGCGSVRGGSSKGTSVRKAKRQGVGEPWVTALAKALPAFIGGNAGSTTGTDDTVAAPTRLAIAHGRGRFGCPSLNVTYCYSVFFRGPVGQTA